MATGVRGVLAAVALALVVASCGQTRYVGVWSTTGGGPSLTLVLNDDGTGTLSYGLRSASLTWHQVLNHIVMVRAGRDLTRATATLGLNGKQLTVNFGDGVAVLARR